MAKTAQVVWIEKQQFMGIDSSKHSVILSSHDEENNTGISPSELLMLALASCTSYDVVSILRKKHQQLTGLKVSVSAEQDEDPPWTFRKMFLHFEVQGIELADSKYCSVAATLRGTVEITHSYTVIEG
jgi:putative redox protein